MFTECASAKAWLSEPQLPGAPPGPPLPPIPGMPIPPDGPGEPPGPMVPPAPVEDPVLPTPPVIDPEPEVDPRERPDGRSEPPASPYDPEPTAVFAWSEDAVSTWSDEDVLPRGRVIDGRYMICSSLGTGGCGTVYAAEDLAEQRLVALKVPHPELDAHLELSRRFRREIRVASLVEHENVLAIYGSGALSDGRPYMAMELVRGESVAQRLLRGRMPIREAVDVALQVLRGLDAAAQKRVVHRDVKPSNIMISTRASETPTARVEAKLIDFGTAKVMGDSTRAEDGVTHSRSLIGTPEYMAPEQFDGLPIDARTDVYGCAAVLYEMLTGSPPQCTKHNTSKHAGSRAPRWSAEKRSIRDARPDCPEALERVVLRALSVSPKRRHQSARAMHDALEDACEVRGPHPWLDALRGFFSDVFLEGASVRR